jgi:hypothetical protein
MKRIRKGYVAVFTMVICSLLTLPVISSAETYPVLREMELGPGTYEETNTDTIRTANDEEYDLNDLIGFEIAVENGSVDDRHRVASAQVFLNDEEIFDQNDFNHHYRGLSETRDCPEGLSRMDLTIKVNGTKKSRLKVTVTGIYPDEEPGGWWIAR